jgi:hypothetical protein
MHMKLIQKLKRLRVEPVAFDPAILDDELALRTEWVPAKGGGTNFRTHRLVQVDPFRMEFKATRGAMAFYALFLGLGLAITSGFSIAIMSGWSRGDAPAFALFIPLLIGVAFAAVGGALFYVGVAPIVFDRRRGEYWKGRVAPSHVANPRALDDHADLDRVHALQIIAEHCSGNDSSYYSYELNLVLDDGTRLPVVDHGNLDELRADVDRLSAFLDKPVWDASG